MDSTKPYLLRSIYEWCIDSGYTPFVTVVANSELDIPMDSMNSGELVFNIGQNAVQDLMIANDIISFYARFNGVSKKIVLPIESVKGIFAKEVNQGIAFQDNSNLVDNQDSAIKEVSTQLTDLVVSEEPKKNTRKKKTQLRLVK